jgi:hypothetical protein
VLRVNHARSLRLTTISHPSTQPACPRDPDRTGIDGGAGAARAPVDRWRVR